MTVKELKQLIENVPDNYQVCYEYDGPDALVDIPAEAIYISVERENICLLAERKS
jgi:hypothetical protein